MLTRLITPLLLAASVAAPAPAQHQPSPPPAQPFKLFVNANIYTLDPAHPRAEALLIDDTQIAFVGSEAQARTYARPDTQITDLAGHTVLPGLIDAHGHVAGLGSFGLGRLDLSRARSFDELVTRLSEAAKSSKKGEWILGGRWDHESWSSRELPTHKSLSDVTPDNPVWLRRVDGHAGLANSLAMRLAGVTRDTPSPAGGEVLKDSRGEPTGVFVDNAMSLIERHAQGPDVTSEQLILKAQEMCLAAGLTGVHDAGVSPGEIDVYRQLEDSGKLKLRVYGMVSGPYAIKYFDTHDLIAGEHFTCRAAKLYMDGAMGSRGAWLLDAYADRPTDAAGHPYAGLSVSQPDLIEAVATHALQKGYQVCTHAIGDRANREVLYAYARAIASAPDSIRSSRGLPNARPQPAPGRGRDDHRFRIEHAQLLSPADIPRFASLGVVASMQPTHCTSDMRWVEARVGTDRAKGAYAWASLLRSGAHLAFGSDFPVESHNPFLGLYAAVTRQDDAQNPAGGWMPREKLTREEALRAFTLGAAYAAFEEGLKGSLERGKLADFIVIDRDVMTCDPRDIPATKVLRTVVGGETVYESRTEPRP